jgi:hypothetical protein
MHTDWNSCSSWPWLVAAVCIEYHWFSCTVITDLRSSHLRHLLVVHVHRRVHLHHVCHHRLILLLIVSYPSTYSPPSFGCLHLLNILGILFLRRPHHLHHLWFLIRLFTVADIVCFVVFASISPSSPLKPPPPSHLPAYNGSPNFVLRTKLQLIRKIHKWWNQIFTITITTDWNNIMCHSTL